MFYIILLGAFLFYKWYGGLTYPPVIWGMEFSELLMLGIVQMIRIFYGFEANRQENRVSTVYFLLLSIASLLVIVHYSYMTTYVLMIEILLGSIIVFLLILEILLSLIAIGKFKTFN